MRMTPLKRFVVFLFMTLLGANVILYVWFAGRTRETSTDEIVQKAYIISRLVSEAAGRSIVLDDPQILRSAVAEAFKDRHILSVTVVDQEEKVLFESVTTRAAGSSSTFRTPVKLGKKQEGTLITAFASSEADERIDSRLRHTVLLQIGLLLGVAALLALYCRRERPLVDSAAETENGRFTPLVATLQADTAPSPALKEPPLLDLFSACRSLQRAAQLLSTEADQQQRSLQHSSRRVEQIADWQRQTCLAAARAEQLVATGEEILRQVKGEMASLCAEEQWLPAALHNTLRQGLNESLAAVTRAEGLVKGALPPSAIATTVGTASNDIAVTAEILTEGAVILREQAIPSFAAAIATGERIGGRLADLLQQLAECGDRSIDLGRSASELFDLAEALRLLRRNTVNSDDPAAVEEECRLQSFAGRLEALAASLKHETRELLGAANGANALARSSEAELAVSRQLLQLTGAAIEDAAVAAVLGGDFLRRHGDGNTAVPVAVSPLALNSQLHEIRELLARQINLLPPIPPSHAQQSVVCAQSLEVAADSLRLAARFLAEMVEASTSLVESPALDSAVASGTADIAVEKLLNEACARLLHHLPPGDGQL